MGPGGMQRGLREVASQHGSWARACGQWGGVGGRQKRASAAGTLPCLPPVHHKSGEKHLKLAASQFFLSSVYMKSKSSPSPASPYL